MTAKPAEAKDLPPITGKDELIAYLASGEKPKADWRVGTEHEKFGFNKDDLLPLPYFGDHGIKAMLDGLISRYGWQPIYEGANVIALEKDGQSVSLEPGGQLELSGAPLETIHQTCDEVNTHLAQVKAIADDLGVAFLGLGFHPLCRRDQIPVMPKGRYGIMQRYMPLKGSLGLDMMFRTCTIQANLDFASEADMVDKFRTSLALQPIATALFANSPLTERARNGFLSFRSHIWTDTDPDRCGIIPFVFEDGFGYERYVDYALDVPMYFVYRDGYIDCAGQSFRDFLDGRLPALPGERPTMVDWANHLTTLFPEVRLKKYLEMRGADGGPWRRICALPALWTGLLYDQAALAAAWDLCKDWTLEDHARLRAEVPRLGLKAQVAGRSVQAVAIDMVEIARSGLAARARLNRVGQDERGFLNTLVEIATSGRTPAEDLLASFDGEAQGSVEPLFRKYQY